MTPKISIVVPCYNHEKFVAQLIESIYAQTFKDFELIVLDDGSKDGSPLILKDLSLKYNFKLVLKENEGICKTLNQGIDLASGTYFIAIASDDFIPPNRLEEQVSFLDKNSDIDVVAGSEIVVDKEGVEKSLKTPSIKGLVSFEEMLKINRVLTATVMMRMSVFDRFGRYNEDHVFEDYHMWLKLLKNGGKIFNTSNMWAYYRVNNPDLEKKFNWYFKGMVQALSDYQDNPLVAQSIMQQRFIYAVKVGLLLGGETFKKYPEVIKQLTTFQKIFIQCLTIIPSSLRDLLLKVLKLKA